MSDHLTQVTVVVAEVSEMDSAALRHLLPLVLGSFAAK
jgi:hypothetical protein